MPSSFSEIITLLTGATGAFAAVVIALIAGARRVYIWRHEYDAMKELQDQRVADITADRDRFRDAFWSERDLFHRAIEAGLIQPPPK